MGPIPTNTTFSILGIGGKFKILTRSDIQGKLIILLDLIEIWM